MSAKLYLTIAAVIAILYGIAFVVIPAEMLQPYGMLPEPHVILAIRLLGSAFLSFGLILWFARDFQDWSAVRGVLIGTVVGDAIGGLVIAWDTIQGTVNTLGWANVVLYALLVLGALYCLSMGSRKLAPAH
jgi:uncharacterized membrane protein YfcA